MSLLYEFVPQLCVCAVSRSMGKGEYAHLHRICELPLVLLAPSEDARLPISAAHEELNLLRV